MPNIKLGNLKTLEFGAPFPDKKMRITVTVFGMYKCQSAARNSEVITKVKIG